MSEQLNRRDILKLISISPFTIWHNQINKLTTSDNQDKPNILIVVFDSLSAKNISFLGYPRETMPKLSSLLDKAIVFHQHFSGGMYTTPGTASLLTGTVPWTHRAINPRGSVTEDTKLYNIFNLFHGHYSTTTAYTHNDFANVLLKQFEQDISLHKPRLDLFLTKDWIGKLFNNDVDAATLGFMQALSKKGENVENSLYFPKFYKLLEDMRISKIEANYGDQFPRGIPSTFKNMFIIEDSIDWFSNITKSMDSPSLSYIHLLPPHLPYRTRNDFFNRFKNDGWEPIEKPEHPFTMGKSQKVLNSARKDYDEFVLYVDSEFHRLYTELEKSGVTENTWIIFTSDHGEMFERGIWAHLHATLHQPITHIPLVIFPPGLDKRMDVYESTSAVDILPTLLHISGQPIPDWAEGEILPPFNNNYDKSRTIYAVEAQTNPANEALTEVMVMMVKDNYKMLSFQGFDVIPEGEQRIELYDLENDPEELEDLSSIKKGVKQSMLEELNSKLEQVNQPYGNNN